jgi:hypothetical protein
MLSIVSLELEHVIFLRSVYWMMPVPVCCTGRSRVPEWAGGSHPVGGEHGSHGWGGPGCVCGHGGGEAWPEHQSRIRDDDWQSGDTESEREQGRGSRTLSLKQEGHGVKISPKLGEILGSAAPVAIKTAWKIYIFLKIGALPRPAPLAWIRPCAWTACV